MGANVRKGVRTALPPSHSTANAGRKGRGHYVELKSAVAKWTRMSEKGGTALSPSHSTANVAREGGGLIRN